MPGRCAVPLCHNQVGGFKFPRNVSQRKQWVHAVKRVTVNKKPWTPSQYDVVCPVHFVEKDYRPPKPFGKILDAIHIPF